MLYKTLALGKSIALGVAAGTALLAAAPVAPSLASSHMDAPLITLDNPANTTDVYAFVSGERPDEAKNLTVALAVNPFEEPGIGPNAYRFDDRVLYEIHVALGDDVPQGRKTLSYQFKFTTEFLRDDTILQSYLGVVGAERRREFDANQNLRQTYRVTLVDHRTGRERDLGTGMVPPNNQGLVTPFYNQNNDGEMPAKIGVSSKKDLDPYTRNAIAKLRKGHRAFAGQRDDGFYADIQSIFDVDFSFGGPNKPFDSQGGFNLHTIVLDIPLESLDGSAVAGVYATTSRDISRIGGYDDDGDDDGDDPDYVQVGRQGNPLFAEALIAIIDKDRYNQTEPTEDDALFATYAETPELSAVLDVTEILPGLIRSIYIPDVIKVDLTTGPARLAGQDGFSRLGFFGGDTLTNSNGETVFGGWPNGRRFGDDVVDIAIIAVGGAGEADLEQPGFGFDGLDVDGVVANDITFNNVFPYAPTPQNGRNHSHHGGPAEAL